ncbi:hypothetical protein GCWU000325_02254 [Alloprevotella tannerae ATCC 51259]|uniref:Uncharacterized protein n=1 Tax=Alloprevotella tannerae ATCC 51259 TaxID=626522 RepID=C9LJ42_9BACT|nr:hypothetical protein GCWU000325_02254 [Alloprevotella tannerae ATCC 51259]
MAARRLLAFCAPSLPFVRLRPRLGRLRSREKRCTLVMKRPCAHDEKGLRS